MPELLTPLTYATSFLSTRQFVVEHNGEEGWTRLRQELAAKHGIELPHDFSNASWLPTLWFTTALNVGRDLFGPADFHAQFGNAAAEYEMSWVHRVALRFTSPLWMLERGRDYWKRAHNTGRWDAEGRTGWIRGTLHEFGVVDAGYCDSLVAWLRRSCMMTGAGKVFVVERQCRARTPGATSCVFEGNW
ncbi:MAG: hypothetical protein JWN44_5995 [Myxococcales bacterium]|nr:hypothetical protein [Myxococcales bacterium]